MKSNTNFKYSQNITDIYLSKIEAVLRRIILTFFLVATVFFVLISVAYSIHMFKNKGLFNALSGLFISVMSVALVKDSLKALYDIKK